MVSHSSGRPDSASCGASRPAVRFLQAGCGLPATGPASETHGSLTIPQKSRPETCHTPFFLSSSLQCVDIFPLKGRKLGFSASPPWQHYSFCPTCHFLLNLRQRKCLGDAACAQDRLTASLCAASSCFCRKDWSVLGNPYFSPCSPCRSGPGVPAALHTHSLPQPRWCDGTEGQGTCETLTERQSLIPELYRHPIDIRATANCHTA